MEVLGPRRTLFKFFLHEGADLLVAETIPYTVASVDNKFVISVAIDHEHFGMSSDSLVLPVELLRILVLIVAEGSAKRQISVDTLVADKMAGLLNARLL